MEIKVTTTPVLFKLGVCALDAANTAAAITASPAVSFPSPSIPLTEKMPTVTHGRNDARNVNPIATQLATNWAVTPFVVEGCPLAYAPGGEPGR